MAGGFKKGVDVEPQQLDCQEATMGGRGSRAHYVVEISVGDAFLDIPIRRKLEFDAYSFSTWLVLLL